MKRELDATAVASSPEHVELLLAQLEGSAAFRSAPRHRAMLRYLVEHALAGDVSVLKETVIAVEVFGRPAGHFDPKLDSIVRVEARRLRARLETYYRGEGRAATLRISLPVGSYVPFVAERELDASPDEASRRAADLVARGEHFLREALSRQTLETALERFDASLRAAPPSAKGLRRHGPRLAQSRDRLAPRADHRHQTRSRSIATGAGARARARHRARPAGGCAEPVRTRLASSAAELPSCPRRWRRKTPSCTRPTAATSSCAVSTTRRSASCCSPARSIRSMSIHAPISPICGSAKAASRTPRPSSMRCSISRPTASARTASPGVLALARGEHGRAVSIYARLCETLPEHPGCLASLAGAHAAAGRIDRADALLEDLHARFGDHIVSPYVLAIVATRAQRGRRRIRPAAAGRCHARPGRALHPVGPQLRLAARRPALAGTGRAGGRPRRARARRPSLNADGRRGGHPHARCAGNARLLVELRAGGTARRAGRRIARLRHRRELAAYAISPCSGLASVAEEIVLSRRTPARPRPPVRRTRRLVALS